MNQLDELLSETARVDDIVPEALQNGHAALNAAIASRSATRSSAAGPLHRQAPRPRRSRRGMFVAASVAAAAAVAAGTIVSVLPGHAGGSRQSGLQPVGGAVTSSAGIDITAAVVLRDAAEVAGQQQGGWPDAAYWHVTSVYETGGKTHHREVWISHRASTVIEDNGVFGNMTPNRGFGGFLVGPTNLSWNQLYALPTDPAKLEPVLMSDIKGTGPTAAAELYSAVGDLLRESPAPPALREALYDVVASIPGVKLVGDYKDALGRTGTAVERDGVTLVVDPDNGQLLAETAGNPSSGVSCGKGCIQYGAASTYVSQGPAASAPALP
jgi:hypothetical protein